MDLPQSWSDLVSRIGAGDRTAEADLVAMFETRVRCLLLARTRNLDTARELTQDVMLNLVDALRKGRIREAESLPAFIHGIARHVLARHRRSVSRGNHVALADGEGVAAASAGDTPDERREIVRDALAALSPTDREILLMILVDGASPAAIAARLGLRADVVRQRKSRAIKRVREQVRTRLSPRRERGRE